MLSLCFFFVQCEQNTQSAVIASTSEHTRAKSKYEFRKKTSKFTFTFAFIHFVQRDVRVRSSPDALQTEPTESVEEGPPESGPHGVIGRWSSGLNTYQQRWRLNKTPWCQTITIWNIPPCRQTLSCVFRFRRQRSILRWSHHVFSFFRDRFCVTLFLMQKNFPPVTKEEEEEEEEEVWASLFLLRSIQID